ADDAIQAPTKASIAIGEILQEIVSTSAAPKGNADADLRALLFISWYDPYRGVVCLVRIVDGEIRKGMRVKLLSTGGIYEVTEMGIFTPKAKLVERLGVGEVGFISGNIKDIVQAK